jgi:hypothetical protein
MDPEYRTMMLWVAVALVASVLAAILIVEWTMRAYG